MEPRRVWGDYPKGGEAVYALPRIPGASGWTGPAHTIALQSWEGRESA